MYSGNRVKEGEFSDVYIERLYIVMCYQMYSSGVQNRRVLIVTSDMGLFMGGLNTGRFGALPVCITNTKIPWVSIFCRIMQEAKFVFLETVTNCNLVTYDKNKIFNETLF
jgi:hypothetical protein